MSEQELDLIQFPASEMTQAGTGTAFMPITA